MVAGSCYRCRMLPMPERVTVGGSGGARRRGGDEIVALGSMYVVVGVEGKDSVAMEDGAVGGGRCVRG